MSGKGKGQNPVAPVRRSSRERKQTSYGSDFVEDDPDLATPPAKPVPSRKTPGKPPGKTPVKPPGKKADPVPPGRQPDPTTNPSKKVTWPSDEEHWKKPTLPRNHSKRPYFIR